MKILIRTQRKEADELPPQVPISWVEISSSVSRQYQFEPDGKLSVKMVDDSRPVAQRMVESFLNKFFPSGYPYSVNEGYLRYTQFRALQHFTSAALSVLSTQSLLFAAGLRPTPAQATAVSWILKDGMQHVGKLICSNLGARMDSEPKRWRILGLHDVHGALCYAVILLISLKELLLHELILLLAFLCHIIKILIIIAFYTAADVLYDLGTGLEVMSPLCPHLFLEVAGLGNFAKGMAVVAARATRLPIYSSFAKEGNLSDLFAKGEAISTLFNVLGLGAGIHLASTICSSMQGKLVVAPLLSIIHVYSVCEEMRATPVNTLNPQRTAMIVAEFVKTGKISSPADLRYQEDLVFPGRLIEDAGNVKVGRSLHEVVSPSKLRQFKETFPEEKFLLNRGSRWTDMILEHDATGEDALRGWMVAAYASDMDLFRQRIIPQRQLAREPSTNISLEAYEKMNSVFSPFLAELQAKGWHTDRFLDGTGSRFVF